MLSFSIYLKVRYELMQYCLSIVIVLVIFRGFELFCFLLFIIQSGYTLYYAIHFSCYFKIILYSSALHLII